MYCQEQCRTAAQRLDKGIHRRDVGQNDGCEPTYKKAKSDFRIFVQLGGRRDPASKPLFLTQICPPAGGAALAHGAEKMGCVEVGKARHRERQGRWTKPPYRPTFPKSLAKSDDPSLGTYQEAPAAAAGGTPTAWGHALPGEVAAADLDNAGILSPADILGHTSLCRSRTARTLSRGNGFRERPALYQLSHQSCRAAPAVFVSPHQWRGARTISQLRALHHDSGLQEGQCATMGEIDGYLDELLKRLMDTRLHRSRLPSSISTPPARSKGIISAISSRMGLPKVRAASGLRKWFGTWPAPESR